MSGVVQQQKCTNHPQWRAAGSVDADPDEGTERKPASPHEPVTNASEGPRQRRSKAFDFRGVYSIELSTDERAHSDPCQIRVCVEVARFARQRGAILGSVNSPRQISERGLHGEADASSIQRLIVPRALHGEEPEVHGELDAKGQVNRAGRRGCHLVTSTAAHARRPANKNQSTCRIEWKTFQSAPPATIAAMITTTAREGAESLPQIATIARTSGAKIIIAVIVTRPPRKRSIDMPDRCSESSESPTRSAIRSLVRSSCNAISRRSTTMLHALILAVRRAASSDAGSAPGIPGAS